MNANNIPAGSHRDCSYQYGGELADKGLAHTTTAYFVVAGLLHVAVRFWRHDYLKTGRIEIYTVEPRDPASSSTELGWNTFAQRDFLGYANEAHPSKTDLVAMCAIAAASEGTYTSAHVGSAKRFAQMEL